MVKREFIVERQGRSFVLYAGLLDLAHSQGLRRIQTQLIQVPGDENGHTAIVRAEVETDRGTFSGIGDANPSNVGRAMLNCTIRLAETRAKARALRDAVNVGVTAFEELGDADESAPSPTVVPESHFASFHSDDNGATSIVSASVPAQRTVNGSSSTVSSGLATPAQVRAIYSIGRDQHNLSEPEIDEQSTTLYGSAPLGLTRKQASDFITSLKGNRS